jgi:hypothetical protein
MPRMQQNALRDPQIPLDAKTQLQHNVSWRAFLQSVPGPPEHEK